MSDYESAAGLNGRRSLMKLLAASPLFAVIGTRSLAAAVSGAVRPSARRSFSDNVYTRLGVRPLINGRGTWTYLSGSLQLADVRKASDAASHFFVDMFELQAAAGRHLAKLSGAESGIVTSGSAGAMALATAACMAGTDPEKIWQLPDTTGMKDEVVMMGGRSPFDSALRLPGARLVVAHTLDDLPGRLTPQTVLVYTTWRDDRLERLLSITQPAGVPLLLDDAAGIPPFDNFTRYAKLGVDLYCFSGGKGLCGPQSAGVLLGRKALIDAAMANNNPWEGAIGRPLKVGKEEIMGMLAAIEYWSHTDLTALNKEWQRRVERIKKLVDTVPGVTTDISVPEDGNSYPTLTVTWDEEKFGLTIAQCDEQLRAGEPRIEVLTSSNPSGVLARLRKGRPRNENEPPQLQIVSMTLQPEEDLIVGNRLRQILSKARRQSA